MNEIKPLLTLTDAAANRVKNLMNDANSEVIGLRIGIKTAGCSGMKYNVEYAMDKKPFEDSITTNGITVLIDPAAVDAIIDQYEHLIGPQIGAGLIARAWSDPAFKAQLVNNTDGILSDLGFGGRQGEHIVVVENTPDCHNLVVCTLCSCYPWPVLGVPPAWYKSDAYRSRAVREPRQVLAEFGVIIPPEQKIRVWDSTAEIRYLVLPMQPAQSHGLDESELALWVNRNAMIGTGLPQPPAKT